MHSYLFLNRVHPPSPGATGRLLAEVADRLASRGGRVTVLACAETGTAMAGARPGGGDLWQVAAPTGRIWRAMAGQRRALLGAARCLPPSDVTIGMSDPPLLPMAVATLAGRGGRLVHWCQDLYPALFEVVGPAHAAPRQARLLRAARAALARYHRVIAIGDCMRARLIGHGVAARDCLTLPNWPERGLAPDAAGALALRAAWGLAADRFVVLYAGTFGRAHRFDGLLAAAGQLECQDAPVDFLLIGAGAQQAAVAAQTSALGLRRVRLLPPQPADRLAATLSLGDLHIASLTPEACGLAVPSKVAAALAVGRPCLFLGPAGSAAAMELGRLGAGACVAPDDGPAIAAAILAARATAAAPRPVLPGLDSGLDRLVAELEAQARLARSGAGGRRQGRG